MTTGVKSLADQTARATGEIGAPIAQIQAAIEDAVQAITGISATMNEVNVFAFAIASALEEQGVATAEITCNVQQTGAGTNTRAATSAIAATTA